MNKRDVIFVPACNESAELLAVANDATPASLFQLADGGALRVPFGDFPQSVLLSGPSLAEAQRAGVKVPASGRVTVIQRVDAAAGNELAADLTSLMGKVRRFFLGAPIYSGHPYHPDAAQRPSYPDKRAYGWIKAVNVEADGLLFEGKYNSLGQEAIEDGQLVFHSPEWNMRLVGVENGIGIYRPARLRSTGLTNEPNIPVPPLVGANEEAGAKVPSGPDEISDEFIDAARELLDAGRRADLEPLAVAVNEALSGDDEGLMDRLAALRARLPDLAGEIQAGNGEIDALEKILGAAAANGIAAAQQGQVSSDQDSSDEPNNEQDNAMLKKLLEALVAAGLIKADDPEEAVLVRLGSLKKEMDWKREEMERQKMEADRIRAALPAANVAELGDAGEDVPLLSTELVTAASNTITTLRSERDALEARLTETRTALVETTLNELTVANAITGADIETVRATLMAANDQAAFAEAVQELRKPGATVPATTRLSADLEGGREKVSAANEIGAQAEERRALVMKHQDRLSKGGKNKQAVYDAAWAAARAERPELF